MLRSLLAAFVVVVSSPVSAQECQSRALPFDSTEQGTIDAMDCTEPRVGRAEYWTFPANADEVIRIAFRSLTGESLFVQPLGPPGALTAQDHTDGVNARSVTFLVRQTGTYRVRFLTSASTSFATYLLLAERSVTPMPSFARAFSTATPLGAASVVGTEINLEWRAVSPTPILEYQLEFGSSEGSSDVGVFSVGTMTQAVASAPHGTYFMRFRARNAAGWGRPSIEKSFATGPPDGPRGLRASKGPLTLQDLVLTWFFPATGEGNVVYYELLVGSSPNSTDLGIHPVGLGVVRNIAERSMYFTNVPPGTYYIRVRAMTNAGLSAHSNEVVVVF